ncbi:MFS transporter [Sphingomonas bacterium]|uniref:MFS transporter n=1 Tax=Sphingomonas bacterium TaxID=1895847 RepID=UPI001575A263|nr:MFS transporter [Sphingomonas bacterium]
MINALSLLKQRRFLPLFTTQFLGAFNDNLFKQSMVLFATYQIFHDQRQESFFNTLASGLFILPFFLFSALAGQIADSTDKARVVRWVKAAEVGIMLIGSAGLLLARTGAVTLPLVLMLTAVAGMGVHSTFFGPVKYAILPQHLGKEDVLGGTGLVEAGTYIAILLGTILAGVIFRDTLAVACGVLAAALAGLVAGRSVPRAPRMGPKLTLDWNVVRASWRLISATMHIPRLFLAICAISFFWTIGIVLIIVFPPLVKNVLTAEAPVASLMLAVFSIGVALGSVIINAMLRGRVSAKFAPASVIAMGAAVFAFWLATDHWTPAAPGHYFGVWQFLSRPGAALVLAALLAISVFGGMFVVPLYAFLTTTVPNDQTARTVAANNVVNSGAMTAGSAIVFLMLAAGATTGQLLLLGVVMCLAAAAIAQRLHLACDGHHWPCREPA